MDPESEEVSREWGALVGGEEEALEHVTQVSKVEDVVEFDCRWRKHLPPDKSVQQNQALTDLSTLGVNCQSCIHKALAKLPQGWLELV